MVAARKTIEEWQEGVYQEEERRSQKLNDVLWDKRHLVEEKISFGTPEEALAACKEFEAWAKELK